MERINATLPRGPFPPAPRISMLLAVAGADVEIFGTSTRPGLTFNIEIGGAGGQGPSCVYSFHRGYYYYYYLLLLLLLLLGTTTTTTYYY